MNTRAFRVLTLPLRRKLADMVYEHLEQYRRYITTNKIGRKLGTTVQCVVRDCKLVVKLYDETYSISHTTDLITVTHSYRYPETSDVYVVIVQIAIDICDFHDAVSESNTLMSLRSELSILIKELGYEQ